MSFSKCGNGTGTNPPGSYTKEDLALGWEETWAQGGEIFDGHWDDDVIEELQKYCAGMAEAEDERATITEKLNEFASVLAREVPLFNDKAAALKSTVDQWLDSNSDRFASGASFIKETAADNFKDGPADDLYPIDPAEGYFYIMALIYARQNFIQQQCGICPLCPLGLTISCRKKSTLLSWS